MSFGGMDKLITAIGGAGTAGSAAAGTGALAAKAASAGGAAAAKGLAGGLAGAKAAATKAAAAGGIGAATKAATAKALSMGFTGGLTGQGALGIGALKGFNPAKVGLGRSAANAPLKQMSNLATQNIGNTANVLKPSNFGQSMQQGLKLNQGGGLGDILKDPKRTKALMAGLETVKGIFDSMEERRRRR